MTIKEILNITSHRPWPLPPENWTYYQEWNNAIFLHWPAEYDELRQFVPGEMEIDLYEGTPWVSLVAFTMEKIRPKHLPPFPPISDFHEINIRTYVRHKNKAGVYFLSIEGGKRLSCLIAKSLSGLPYRYSKMTRTNNQYTSFNAQHSDKLEFEFEVGKRLNNKTSLDKWLTERYTLFQDSKDSINEFEIHHVEWPIYQIITKQLEVVYPRFNCLLNAKPSLTHYSTGVQILAWDKKIYPIQQQSNG